jgi:hypothetical protein
MKAKIKNLTTKQSTKPIASTLFKKIEEREKNLFENDAFLAAVYLDPRFNFSGSQLLNESQKELAQVKI